MKTFRRRVACPSSAKKLLHGDRKRAKMLARMLGFGLFINIPHCLLALVHYSAEMHGRLAHSSTTVRSGTELHVLCARARSDLLKLSLRLELAREVRPSCPRRSLRGKLHQQRARDKNPSVYFQPVTFSSSRTKFEPVSAVLACSAVMVFSSMKSQSSFCCFSYCSTSAQ